MVPKGQDRLPRVGFHRSILSDIYHFFLTTSWPIFLLILIGLFGLLNTLFALAYLLGDHAIANARPGSFADAFFFSVQTLATLGYGNFAPVGIYANIVSVLEVFTGLLSLALVTGLTFAKFSRPTARILFSKMALISKRNGVPTLMFRLANERTNRIVEAHLYVGILLTETSLEGQVLRRFHDMKLVRSQTPVFGLSWIAFHPIDEESPLFNMSFQELQQLDAEIVVNFSGIDDTLLQSVHRQHFYLTQDIIWNAVFEDILVQNSEGQDYMDYLRFHQIRNLPPEDPGYISEN